MFIFTFLFCRLEVLEKAKAQIGVLKDLFSRLAEIIRECPGQYYRWGKLMFDFLYFIFFFWIFSLLPLLLVITNMGFCVFD